MNAAAALPKAELHCHIEGAMPPALARSIARRNGLALPHDLTGADGRWAWSDFPSFLETYDRAAGVLRTAADYAELVQAYLAGCAAEGAIYVEIFCSPDHAAAIGLPYGEQLRGLADGIDRAQAAHGIVCRIVVICLRHLGPARARDLAAVMLAERHPHVVGFGMAGAETMHDAADFAPAFALVDAAGYPCTAHAGEVVGAESVRAALAALPLQRIGHGVRAIEDPLLVRELVRRGVTLEVCPGSNIALGLYRDRRDHPLRRLLEAGCRVTLNSDDPAFFDTSIGREYDLAADELGFSRAELAGITRVALEAAFVDESTRERLLQRLDASSTVTEGDRT